MDDVSFIQMYGSQRNSTVTSSPTNWKVEFNFHAFLLNGFVKQNKSDLMG
jgi:hypothetical protein